MKDRDEQSMYTIATKTGFPKGKHIRNASFISAPKRLLSDGNTNTQQLLVLRRAVSRLKSSLCDGQEFTKCNCTWGLKKKKRKKGEKKEGSERIVELSQKVLSSEEKAFISPFNYVHVQTLCTV